MKPIKNPPFATSETAYFGLDLETSGTDPDKHQAIQLGLVPYLPEFSLARSDVFSVISRFDPERFEWSETAADVHGICREDALEAEDPRIVDARAVTYLAEFGIFESQQMKRKAVGWNVASFDMPFVKREYPLLYSLISYRTIDLNAICDSLDGKPHGGTGLWSFDRAKKESKEYAVDRAKSLGLDVAWHDAGFDAWASLESFNFLRAAVANATFPHSATWTT